MDQKVMRLLHLFRSLAPRAHAMAAGGLSTAGYQAIGRMFNDYIEQLQAIAGDEFVSRLDPIDVPDDPSMVEPFLADLALRADQIASEVAYTLRHAGDVDEANREDWADALIRLSEAGIDADTLIEKMAFMGGPAGTIDRRFVDRLAKLAQAGVDVDDLLEKMPFLGSHGNLGPHHHSGFARRPRPSRPASPAFPPGPHFMSMEHRGGRRPRRIAPVDCDVDFADDASHSEGRRDTAWRTDILTRVEKGEITPDAAVGLLREGRGSRKGQEEREEREVREEHEE